MTWPPKFGDRHPRAAEAWFADEKWTGWIFAERGHAHEWARVFRVDLADHDRVWEAITAASLTTHIDTVRVAPDGITCTVAAEITIGERTATVRIVWHCSEQRSAPRLMTAYPTL